MPTYANTPLGPVKMYSPEELKAREAKKRRAYGWGAAVGIAGFLFTVGTIPLLGALLAALIAGALVCGTLLPDE